MIDRKSTQHLSRTRCALRFALLLLLLVAPPSTADTTGLLGGVVRDADGIPLIGASVLVEGTVFGTMTDAAGEYVIAGLPPGSYAVTARMVGHAPSRVVEVGVAVGQLTRLDFDLEIDPSGTTEIRVTESRSRTLQDVPTTLHLLDLGDMRTLSSGNILRMIASSPGVVTHGGEMYVRGGRAGEVDYLLDGVSLRSPMDNRFDLELPLGAISNAAMMTGGLSVEYGNAMSGIVNLISEEGDETFEGGVAVRRGASTVATGGSAESVYMEQTDFETCRTGLTAVEGSVSGPEPITGILLPALGVEFPGILTMSAAGQVTVSGRDTLDTRGAWENAWRTDASGMARLTCRPGPRTGFSLGVLGAYRESGWNEWAWSRYHLPALIGSEPYLGGSQDFALPVRFSETAGLTCNATRLLGSGTTVKLTLGALRFQDWHRVRNPEGGWVGEGTNPVYWLTQYVPEELEQDSLGFYHSGVHPNVWMDSKAEVSTAMLDLDSNPSPRFRIKTGISATYYDLYQYSVYALGAGEVYLSQWDAWPHSGAAYVQGSFRFPGGVITTAGLRAEQFDANTVVPDPETGASRRVDAKWQISPRLGFSVPFSERSVFFTTFGHYFQMPPMYCLFLQTAYNFAEDRIVAGNPDLEPERTQLFESGIRYAVDEVTDLSISGYYKDITGLVSTEDHEEGTYYVFTNDRSHGMARGLELVLSRSPGERVSGDVSYCLSVAKGRYSSMLELYNYAQTGIVYISSEDNYLDWDQTHTAGASVALSCFEGEGPRIAGIRPFENSSLGLSFSFGSGVPYTLPPATGELVETNTERYPSNTQTDLTLSRRVELGPVDLELLLGIYNLFDRKNIVSIYDTALFHQTGDPTGTSGNPRAWSPARHFLLTAAVRW